MLLVLQSRQNSIYFVASIDKGFKTITNCCLQHLKQLKKVRHFEETTHACAFCFCLGVPRLFVSDTSLKRIDRVGLGKRRTGTRQRWTLVIVWNFKMCLSHLQELISDVPLVNFFLDSTRLITRSRLSYYNWTYGACQLIFCKITKKRFSNYFSVFSMISLSNASPRHWK